MGGFPDIPIHCEGVSIFRVPTVMVEAINYILSPNPQKRIQPTNEVINDEVIEVST